MQKLSFYEMGIFRFKRAGSGLTGDKKTMPGWRCPDGYLNIAGYDFNVDRG